MGKLKPIGSEKLTGKDKVARIMEIARYGEVTKNEDYHVASKSFTKNAADGNVYSIVQEKDGYYLKSGINESELDYVSGFMNKKKDRFKSYSAALKRMNLIFKPLNEQFNDGEGDGMYDEMDEQEKFVLNVPNEEGEEELDLDVEDDMGGEELDFDVEDDIEDETGDEELDLDVEDEMGDDIEGEEDMEGFMKSIQKLTGKLGQKLRDVEEEMGSADIKYVLNSIISAVDLENLDDEDKDDVLDRFEEDETTYGDEEDIDMGDEEVDLDMDVDLDDEEVDLDVEDEEEFAMESLKKRVGDLLESYTTQKKNKSVSSKDYLKNRITNIIKEKKIVEATNTIEQSLTVKKILKENSDLRLEGQTKRGEMVLTGKNKKVIVKKDGTIK